MVRCINIPDIFASDSYIMVKSSDQWSVIQMFGGSSAFAVLFLKLELNGAKSVGFTQLVDSAFSM